MPRLKRLHHFLAGHLFYPLVVSSVASELAYLIWLQWTTENAWKGPLGNLFLAWIPYLCSLGLDAAERSSKYLQAFLVLFWFLFFPNAPYVLTDFVHLQPIPTMDPLVPFRWWYDLGGMILFAWTGNFLAVASLYIVHGRVERVWGKSWGWVFALAMIAASGMGIYLGRDIRWNSWDIMIHPLRIGKDVLAPLVHPYHHLRALGLILMYGLITFVTYFLYFSARQVGRATERTENVHDPV